MLIIPSVIALLGDNPMQSELSCHIGSMGKFFCRVCHVKGSDAKDNTPMVDLPNPVHQDPLGSAIPSIEESQGLSTAGSSESLAQAAPDTGVGITTGSVAGSNASQPDLVGPLTKQPGRKKKLETMSEMVERVKRFVRVRFLLSSNMLCADRQQQQKSQVNHIQLIIPAINSAPCFL